MNKIHLLWKIPVFLIILVLLINIFDFVGATRIKVVDGLTGEPLQNINVEQNITGETLSPVGGNAYRIRLLEKMTNSNGIVSFPVKFQIHVPILKIFGEERIIVNQHSQEVKFNDNYYISGIEFGLKHLFPYKSRTIKLTPYVDELSQCKDDKECIFFNSYDLALLNDDESYCENLLLREKGGEFATRTCYSILAVSRRDINLCDKISFDEYGRQTCRSWVEDNWGEKMCTARWKGEDDRWFRACNSLFEK